MLLLLVRIFFVVAFPAFVADVEPGANALTLSALQRWFFRESRLRAAPKKPTLGDRRRPLYGEEREDMLQERTARAQRVAEMKERVGRRVRLP